MATIQEIQNIAAELIVLKKQYQTEVEQMSQYITKTRATRDEVASCLNRDHVLNQITELNLYINHFIAQLYQKNSERLSHFSPTIDRYHRRIKLVLQAIGKTVNQLEAKLNYEQQVNSLLINPAYATYINDINLFDIQNYLQYLNGLHQFNDVEGIQNIPLVTKGNPELILAILFSMSTRLLEASAATFTKVDEAQAILANYDRALEEATQKLAFSQNNLDTATEWLTRALTLLDESDAVFFQTKHSPFAAENAKKKINQQLDNIADKMLSAKRSEFVIKHSIENGLLKRLIDDLSQKFGYTFDPKQYEPAVGYSATITCIAHDYFRKCQEQTQTNHSSHDAPQQRPSSPDRNQF